MKENYIKVKVEEYVKSLLELGYLPILAEKKGKIHARRGIVGEEVITWSEDENGNPIVEKTDIVSLDKETNEPEYVVTKVDDTGMPICDKHCHVNSWIIKPLVFKEKYTLDFVDESLQGLIYKSSAGVQVFIPVMDNIELFQWGESIKIAKGGYINITKENDMYGISSRDFNDTYEIVQSKEKKLHK